LSNLLRVEHGVPSAVVGIELYRRLAVPLGDVVVLTTPLGIARASGNAPTRMPVRISGVLRTGFHDFDAAFALVELSVSQRLFGTGAAVYGLDVKVKDPEHVDLIAQRISGVLGGVPFVTEDWRQMSSGTFTAVSLMRVVMFLVLSFIVIVASFNVASTLFMAVIERAAEIAVLKAMGARDTSIMRIFVAQGWILGGAGTLLGLALGLVTARLLGWLSVSLASDVYKVDHLTVRFTLGELVLTCIVSMVIAHLATLYPALSAAQQRPVDAMRYE
jgi:lipoprotein-releasing system permease protein